MPTRIDLVSVMICISAAALGCAASDTVSDTTRSQDVPIENGTEAKNHPEGVLLDIRLDGTDKFAQCSGTLLLPSLVLTAKHCLQPSIGGVLPDATVARIDVTAPYAAPGSVQRVTGRVPALLHPASVDLALIQVDPPVTGAIPPVVPAPLPLLPDGELPVDIVGRRDNDAISGDKLFTVRTTARYEDSMFAALPPDVARQSDSGGPVFLVGEEDGARALTAVISRTRAEDDSTVLVQRVDAALDWLISATVRVQTGQPLSATSSDSCDELGYFGACDGQTLRYCNGDGLHEVDCAEAGGSCLLTGDSGYDCGYTGDACGDVTFDGVCNGSTLIYCDETLQVVDCASLGLHCAPDPALGGFNCL